MSQQKGVSDDKTEGFSKGQMEGGVGMGMNRKDMSRVKSRNG